MLARLHGGEAEEYAREIAQFTRLPEPYRAFIAWDGDRPIGLIDYRIRNYAEGAPSLRAAYVEDLWVEPSHRGRGIAAGLLAAVEAWARSEGLDWLGSDTMPDNAASISWHGRHGFEEFERLVVFGKPLR